MSNQLIHDIVKRHLNPANKYVYGFANLTGLLHEKFNCYSYAISIGRRLDDWIIDGIKEAPTIEYFHHYDEINEQLLGVSVQIATDLQQAGIGALAIMPTIPMNSTEFDEYLPTLRYEVSQKMVATRAGLGWIGKTDLFISKKFGARLRLGSILINKEVKPRIQTD